jgi:hypothetical protein
MRFMEAIRRKGHWGLIIFLVIFTITLFFGLSIGNFGMPGAGMQDPSQQDISKAPVISTEVGKDTALLVNDRKVSNSVYNQVVRHFIDQYTRSEDDPTANLTAYGYAVNMLVNQEVLIAYGEEHGLKMTGADWDKAKEEVSSSLMEGQAEKSGNILGDSLGKLNELKAKKAAFEEYLGMMGLTESQWQADSRRDLYTRKVQETIREEMNAAKKLANEEKKAAIDKELAGGKDFAEVAKAHSEGPQHESGGDVDWIGRGLLEPEVTEKLFAVEKGKTSDWIETPAWLKKFLIVDKQEAKGPEFEKAKPDLIKQIRDEKKDQVYEPSQEELAEKYERVKARVIDVAVTDDNKANERIQQMIESARVQVNNPYALAYQALKDSKLQPAPGVTKEDLITIAKLSPMGEEYDWSVLDKKLKAGEPKAADKDDAEDDAAADDDADNADDATAEDDSAKPDLSGAAEMTDSAADAEELVTTPIYALAAGLIEKANQDSNNTADPWPMYMLAKIYSDWMKDSAEANKQPIKTAEARTKLDTLLAEVVKGNNYSALAFAMQGLNYARLDKPTEAAAALATAEKYAPTAPGDVWDTVREGYKVLDNPAKLAEVDAKIQDMQQKQFQEMMQRQIQQQMGGQGGGAPIQIPMQ